MIPEWLSEPWSYAEHGKAIGELVARKQREYGHTAAAVARIMAVLYPEGVPPHAYEDALLLVRLLDKVCRISARDVTRQDKGGESPWNDIAGYALIAQRQDAERKK